MNLIFFGPPGVGKGTIAKKISTVQEIPHISSGDILRAAIKKGTKLGEIAAEYMDVGKLVPDHFVIDLVKRRIGMPDCKQGFILDGFPRTIGQAEALEQHGIVIDKVINFIADDSVIVSRISGRRICTKCSEIYHIKNNPPKVAGICDHDGAELYQRPDDKQETIKRRLEIYRLESSSLIDHYRNKNLLADIDGEGSITQMTTDTLTALK
ncbi:MAG TPA: adenylate kinase [Candidatus Nanoarchaeia archaeon]|nr:adenylate kinase [Candidatus Nanoarchaeia archaeon]